MMIAVAVLIVGGVLTVSAAVVLLSLATEAEVLPGLRQGGASGDETSHSPPKQGSASGITHRARTQVSLTE